MRIAVVCNDTRGGVQPYVALARGLVDAGHEVAGVAPASLCQLFSSAGIPVTALSGSERAAALLETGIAEQGNLASMTTMIRELPAQMALWTKETLYACAGSDVLTGGIGGMVIGRGVAEKLRIPFIQTHLQPVSAPTSAYRGLLFASPAWAGRWATLLSHHASELALWTPFHFAAASARKTVLGLSASPRSLRGQLALYGFSRDVVPLPDDPTRQRFVTGYWADTLWRDWEPSEALRNFVARPDSIVSVGFGSMGSKDPSALAKVVIQAARKASARVVLLTGWKGLAAQQEDDVFVTDSVPHGWLFPRMSTNVHHGGAGTTGAALSSGRPSIVIPFVADQFFWASRTTALRVGPKPIPRKRLTAFNLAEAMRMTLNDPSFAAHASSLGLRLGQERGVDTAVDHFNRLRL